MAQSQPLLINRAPVLTLWAAIVAERLGFDHDEALTLGRAVAGLNAYSKGVRLGLYEPTPEAERERRETAKAGQSLHVDLLHRAVPVVQTAGGLRAVSGGRPIAPESVEGYLAAKFGHALDEVRAAMRERAQSLPPAVLARAAYRIYEEFRPPIPSGVAGWGAKGPLDLMGVAGRRAPVPA